MAYLCGPGNGDDPGEYEYDGTGEYGNGETIIRYDTEGEQRVDSAEND